MNAKLPDALVEKMARHLYDENWRAVWNVRHANEVWNGDPDVRSYWHGQAETLAAALLDECEVDYEYRLVGASGAVAGSWWPVEFDGWSQRRIRIHGPIELPAAPDPSVVSFPRLDTGPEETPP